MEVKYIIIPLLVIAALLGMAYGVCFLRGKIVTRPGRLERVYNEGYEAGYPDGLKGGDEKFTNMLRDEKNEFEKVLATDKKTYEATLTKEKQTYEKNLADDKLRYEQTLEDDKKRYEKEVEKSYIAGINQGTDDMISEIDSAIELNDGKKKKSKKQNWNSVKQ